MTDIAPRTKGHMHATDSLDFLIVHKGQVTLHLDSGEKKQIKEGEVIGKSVPWTQGKEADLGKYKGGQIMLGRMKRMNGSGCTLCFFMRIDLLFSLYKK